MTVWIIVAVVVSAAIISYSYISGNPNSTQNISSNNNLMSLKDIITNKLNGTSNY